MKIDMSREAVTRRLKIVCELRRTCLSLADSSAGKKIQQKHTGNRLVLRTRQALGR